MDNQLTFDSLFDGMNLTPEFNEKLKTVFEEAVQNKVLEELIKMEEQEEVVTLSSEAKPVAEDDDAALETEVEVVEDDVDAKDLVMDPDMLRVLRALGVNPAAFARSLQAAKSDIEGNSIADDAFTHIITILKAISDNSTLAAKLVSVLKDSKPEESEPEVAEEDTEEENVVVYESLVNSIDDYLNYIAESWVEENKLAIEQGQKLEVMESFFNGMKTLFTEHNVVVPDAKDANAEIIVGLNAKIENLDNQLTEHITLSERQINEEITKTISYKNKFEEEVKKNCLESAAKDLTVVQKERFKKLIESVEFENKSSYEEKLNEVAKTAFDVSTKTSKKNLTEDSLNENSESEQILADNPMMNLYASAISKKLKF